MSENEIEKYYNNDVFKHIVSELKLDFDSVKKIGGFENIIYEVEDMKCNFILRVTHESHRNIDLLNGEMEWMNFLWERGVSVPKPILFTSIGFVKTVTFNESIFYISKYSVALGRHLGRKDWNNDTITLFGQEIGKLHKSSKKYMASNIKTKRPNWDNDIFIIKNRGLSDLKNIYNKYEDIVRQIKKRPITKNNFGLTHGDIHFGNVKISDNKITIFDLDECAYNWYSNDIAVFLFFSILWHCKDDKKNEFINNFLKYFLIGYQQYVQLDKDILISNLPLFLKLREFDLFFALNDLPENEYYDFEKEFMNGRRERIENGTPFAELKC